MLNSQFEIRLEQSRKRYTVSFWEKKVSTPATTAFRKSKVLTQMELLLMLQTCKPGFEVLFAIGAFKGFILRVQNHMFLQVRSSRKRFLANLRENTHKT